jgi:hypothetical protein
VADWPGTTVRDEGVTAISKSALAGRTLILRRGGLGSELPAASIKVNDATYSPAVLKVTFPGVLVVATEGLPPGKIHEYLLELVAEANDTVSPALMVTSADGKLIEPEGGADMTVASSTNPAFDGTPEESMRKSM